MGFPTRSAGMGFPTCSAGMGFPTYSAGMGLHEKAGGYGSSPRSVPDTAEPHSLAAPGISPLLSKPLLQLLPLHARAGQLLNQLANSMLVFRAELPQSDSLGAGSGGGTHFSFCRYTEEINRKETTSRKIKTRENMLTLALTLYFLQVHRRRDQLERTALRKIKTREKCIS